MKRFVVITVALLVLIAVAICIRAESRRRELEFNRQLLTVLHGCATPTLGTAG